LVHLVKAVHPFIHPFNLGDLVLFIGTVVLVIIAIGVVLGVAILVVAVTIGVGLLFSFQDHRLGSC